MIVIIGIIQTEKALGSIHCLGCGKTYPFTLLFDGQAISIASYHASNWFWLAISGGGSGKTVDVIDWLSEVKREVDSINCERSSFSSYLVVKLIVQNI